MIRRKMSAGAVALGLAVGVAACGGSSGSAESSSSEGSATTQSSGQQASSHLSVAMVIPGAINDKGFNQTGYEGLQQCKQNGAQTTYKEEVPVPEYTHTFQTFARSNQLVIGHGFQFGEIVAKVAPEFPERKFIVTSDPLQSKAGNVEELMPNSTQGAYLAGVVAGEVTKTNKIGGVAGFEFPVLEAQMKAFEQGAKAVNPKVTMKVVYLGTFEDVAKGKEAAMSMAASGIDVVYQIADAAGLGVIQGAKAAGIKAIGWGKDQNSLAPNTVIASQLEDQAKMIGDACQAVSEGKFEGGHVVVGGLRSGMVGLSKVYDEPPSVQQAVDSYRKKILEGSAKVVSVGGNIPGSGPHSG